MHKNTSNAVLRTSAILYFTTIIVMMTNASDAETFACMSGDQDILKLRVHHLGVMNDRGTFVSSTLPNENVTLDILIQNVPMHPSDEDSYPDSCMQLPVNSFTSIVQVVDENGVTRSINWIIHGETSDKQLVSSTFQYMTGEPGKYEIIYLAWDSIDNPTTALCERYVKVFEVEEK